MSCLSLPLDRIFCAEASDMKTTKELLGARIRELRKSHGFSQERLAEMIDVEPRHMSRIEGGKSYPSLDRLERISHALKSPLKEFFEFGHLEENVDRAADIAEMVIKMGEESQRLVYKIVKAIDDK
jgi:transcriptional regulator with XRE-family HTH domain